MHVSVVGGGRNLLGKLFLWGLGVWLKKIVKENEEGTSDSRESLCARAVDSGWT